MSLASWKTVAERLLNSYEKIQSEISNTEYSILGWTSGGDHSFGHDPNFRVSEFDGSRSKRKTFDELFRSLDDDLLTTGDSTEIYFINGSAGSGKTRALLKAAIDRARLVAESGSAESARTPLYLYVQAGGNILAQLSDAISLAVGSTRNLTDESVAALCRNGLMLLLIDGVDELLGGTGYSDALGSLRGWLERLSNKGVVVVSARSSYYLRQYKSSINKAAARSDLTLRHQVAEICDWTDNDILDYFRNNNVQPSTFRTLERSNRQLLRLPFFARATVEFIHHNSGERGRVGVGGGSLIEALISRYVKRESSKFDGHSRGDQLLSEAELERIFELCAEMMSERADRMLDLDDLELAAAMAIEDEISSRPGLHSRLSVLCGLNMVDSSRQATFSFSHEIFFDFFVAGALTAYLEAGDYVNAKSSIAAVQLRVAAVERLATKCDSEPIVEFLLEISQDRNPRSEALMANLGSLWAKVLDAKEHFQNALISAGTIQNDVLISKAMFLDKPDFSTMPVSSLKLVDCVIGQLDLNAGSRPEIYFESTQIGELRIDAEVRRVHFDESCVVEALLQDRKYYDNRVEIYKVLTGAGVDVRVARNVEDSIANPRLEEVARILRKLDAGGSLVLVLVERTLMPEDQRIDWIRYVDDNTWRYFVHSAVECDLARVETFAASGSAKIKFRMLVSPAELLERGDLDRGDAPKFWNLMNQ